MREGDLVIVYRDDRSSYLVKVKKGGRLQTHHGDIEHNEILKKNLGEVIRTHLDKEFYLLPPSHYDRMMKVKRKTTILYPKDAGYLMLKTDVGPGSRVIEVGSGSGALTCLLASIVGPEGKVYSYERRDDLLTITRTNVERYQLLDRVVFHLGDVAREGFQEENVDAVFIDVPEPWAIIPEAYSALKGGGFLVSLSPNLEQVKRSVEAMSNFKRIEVVEILLREIMVRKEGTRPKERAIVHTGYLISGQRILRPVQT
ncbi:MAG TPA: tRNA (adenine-N1)-methyltransferase [bacterium (Candidatus Stahlbacteria)]|nr:tRNA (adenine-N1)-methyltransferase [Candidatus Stahlbacteria bacterium]